MDRRPFTRRTRFFFFQSLHQILSLKAFKRQKHHELFAVNGHGEHHLSMKRLSLSNFKEPLIGSCFHFLMFLSKNNSVPIQLMSQNKPTVPVSLHKVPNELNAKSNFFMKWF